MRNLYRERLLLPSSWKFPQEEGLTLPQDSSVGCLCGISA